jgi:tRNA G37 N-methylase Trm5
MVRLTGQRGLNFLINKPATFSQGIQVTGTTILPLMYSHARYNPHANTQLHHQMKMHIYLNSHSSKHWKYFQEVMDNIFKNMRNLCIFVFLLVAPRGECLRNSGKMT